MTNANLCLTPFQELHVDKKREIFLADPGSKFWIYLSNLECCPHIINMSLTGLGGSDGITSKASTSANSALCILPILQLKRVKSHPRVC